MIEIAIVLLMFIWLIGLFTGTAGNFIHLVLVTALIIFGVRFFTGRKAI